MNTDNTLLTAPKLLLRASAGTGKTFTLATRMMGLLARGEDPSSILALTFTKAAAGEIYAKLAERLADAAGSETAAQEESKRLGMSLRCCDFADILRRVIASQHIGSVATLDSFLMNILKFFPLEFGFSQSIELLDPYREEQARKQIAAALLDSRDPTIAAPLLESFEEADGGEAQTSFRERLLELIKYQSDFLRRHPESPNTLKARFAEWNAGKYPKNETEKVFDETEKSADKIVVDQIKAFIKKCHTWNGKSNPITAFSGKMTEAFLRDINADGFDYKKNTYRVSSELAQAVHHDLDAAVLYYLGGRIQQAIGEGRLVAQFNARYDSDVRRRGKVTFGDFADILAKQKKPERKNLEYRFDQQFRHWAIDEFQDTSRTQWNCLKDLVEEALCDDGDRSVTVLGDIKQAIYAWRGGDERLFLDLMKRPEFTVRNLATSYRYGKNTCAFVNKLFGKELTDAFRQTLQSERTALSASAAEESAVARWQEAGSWQEHTTAGDDSDYVRLTQTQKLSKEESKERNALHESVCADVDALWHGYHTRHPNETVAVLVRTNKDGEKLADYLRAHDLPAVMEGESSIAALPTVQGILALLRLAEHPQDTAAWQIINLMPVKQLICPETDPDNPKATADWVSRQLSCRGLTRTLGDWCDICRASETYQPDTFSDRAFDTLVAVTADFEAGADADQSIDDYLNCLDNATKRDSADDPSVIRILTVDRSKGLGFDHVFVPVDNGDSMQFGGKFNTIENDEGPDAWQLPHISKEFFSFHGIGDTALQAWARQCDRNILAALHKYYVAFTRSKKSLWMYITPKSANPTATHFPDMLHEMKGLNASGSILCEAGPQPTSAGETDHTAASEKTATPGWTSPGGRPDLPRATPSKIGHGGGETSMGTAFGATYGMAAQRGTDMHARFETIDWIDPAAPKNDFEKDIAGSPLMEAFTKTADVCDLWREYSYERLTEDGCWESGQMDRVVFFGEGNRRRAVVYDFKTNRNYGNLPLPDFEESLRTLYTGQMRAYRTALRALTGIPLQNIRSKLLLTDTHTVVEVND